MTISLPTIIEIFSQSFKQLGVPISADALEGLAVTVHKALTGPSRRYHSLEHALEFWNPENPIQTLAGLYHDIVYYHVDMGYHPEISRIITPYLNLDNEQPMVAVVPINEDRISQLTLAAFGFLPGRILGPDNGLNEFLSALFMNLSLGQYLSEVTLLRMTLCIEATIPFRPNEYFESFVRRLAEIDSIFHLGLTQMEMKGMIKAAVIFANIDVKNFAENDVAVLLDDTWKLLPELNFALRYGIYTVREYRMALQKMHRFMSALLPERVFHQFDDTPTADEFRQILSVTRANLSLAQDYLQIKLLTAAVLEALAEVSGGDAPVALFLGDPTDSGQNSHKIDEFLPEPKDAHLIDERSRLFQLLTEGKVTKPENGLRNTSLSLFVYKSLDPSLASAKILTAQRFFAGEIDAAEFLAGCKGSVISAIARAIAIMVPTRQEKLFDLANLLSSHETA